jgi:hypothetical protein
MSESPEARSRRRLINLGELIALASLIVSALGVWIAWRGNSTHNATRVVEEKSAVPLALRGTVDGDGRTLTIVPADPLHALQSAKLTIKGALPIEMGSDGRLTAGDVEGALKGREKENKDVTYSVPIRIDARYVESGADRRGGGAYTLRYKWEGGGLFRSRSVRLVGLSR